MYNAMVDRIGNFRREVLEHAVGLSIHRNLDSCVAKLINILDLTKNFNQVQVYVLLALMAQITGHKAGKAYHKIVNAHIYENQLELMRDVQLKREPFASPSLKINPDIKSLEDLETWVTSADFEVIGYEAHEGIQYPFSV
jgi:thymidylate synthase